MRKAIAVAFLLFGVYLISYAAFRQANIEIWEKDQKAYVIFPESPVALYYFYRPLSYIDSKLTGMNFHIGPHR